MARYIVGKTTDSYKGLTGVNSANTLQLRDIGQVANPGRIVRLGAWLGANSAPVSSAKLAAYLMEGLWTPALLTLTAWFKADAITGVADGGSIASWVDSSGNGNTATQSGSASRPTYRAIRANGLPGVEFDGADDFLAITGVSSSSLNESIYAVVDLSATPVTRVTLVGGENGGRHLVVNSSRALEYRKQNTTLIDASAGIITVGADTIVGGSLGATTGEETINGTVESFTHAQTLTAGLTSAIGAALTVGEFWDGDIHEIVILPATSLLQRTLIEGYLAHKWGITLAPGHPYAVIPPIVSSSAANSDPTTKLLESAPFSLSNVWDGTAAGGANYEFPADYLWTPDILLSTGRVKFWFAADKLTGIADGAEIPQLTDFSGSGNHGIQATSANRALMRYNALNNLPAADFDGVDDYYDTNLSPQSTDESVFAVFRFADQPTTNATIVTSEVNGGRRVYINNSGGVVLDRAGIATIGSSPIGGVADDTNAIIHAYRDGTNWAFYINGSSRESGTTTSVYTGGTKTRIGEPDTKTPDGYLYELIIISPRVDTAENSLIFGYLSWKYGLQVNLPANNIYRNLPALKRGTVVTTGQEVGVGVAGNGAIRRPQPLFIGGKKWEQAVTGLALPSPMAPTVETVDDRDISSYVVVEENRAPVITDMQPSGGAVFNKILANVSPAFTITTTDPDRADGHPDYLRAAIVRVWEKFKGSLFLVGQNLYNLVPTPNVVENPSTHSVTWPDFTPQNDIGPRMNLEYQPWQSGLADVTPVSMLSDISGNSNNATQNTTANKPTFRTNQVNTLGALDFDGTDDFMTIAGLSASSLDEAVFLVVRVDSLAHINTFLGPTVDSGGRWFYVTTTGRITVGKQGVSNVGITTATITTGTWYVIHYVMTPTGIRLGINGTVENYPHAMTFTAGLVSMLGMSSITGTPLPFDGMIADMISIKSSELRPGDEERYIGYLAWKYGIQTSLPTSFPYRTFRPGLRYSPPPSTEQFNAAGAVTFSTNRFDDPLQADNTAVATWVDNRILATPLAPQNATQATGANQPTYRANRLNGKGVLDFDGVNDYLSTTISSSLTDEFLVAVIRPRAYGAVKGTTGSGGSIYSFDATGHPKINKNGTGDIAVATTVTAPLNEWSIVSWLIRDASFSGASNWRIGVNGTFDIGTHAQTLTASLTSLIGAGTTAATFFNGEIARFIRMPASGIAINDIERWVGRLAWEYGLQSKLPDTHMYRFSSPDAAIEHQWTAEVRDEIGGITGTGYGGRNLDNELPDGSTTFFPALQGYASLGYPGAADPLAAGRKVVTRTPNFFSSLYTHVLNKSLVKKQVRLLKKNLNGEFFIDQVSPVISVSPPVAPSVTVPVQVSWKESGFIPLDIGADYAVQWRWTDASDVSSTWTGSQEFHVNYPPKQGIITTPDSPTAVTGLPLVLFSVDDSDDVGVAYFPSVDALIYELQWGSNGTAAGQFQLPRVVDYSNGTIYVLEKTGARVQWFTSSGGYLGVRALGYATGAGMQVNDASGNIYVTDTAASAIKKYDAVGLLAVVGSTFQYFDLAMTAPVQTSPIAVTRSIAPSWGTVSDPPFNASSGSYLANPKDSAIRGAPGGIDVLNDDVWVVDPISVQVMHFKLSTGEFIGSFGVSGWNAGEMVSPRGIVSHPLTGNLWVGDPSRHKVIEFAFDGTFLREYGTLGSGTGDQLNAPFSLDFDTAGDKLFIADFNNHFIKKARVAQEADLQDKGVCGEAAIIGPLSLSNQSFDSVLTGWDNHNPGLIIYTNAISGDLPYKGAAFVRSTLTSGPNYVHAFIGAGGIQSTDTFPVVPGFTYTAKAVFRRSNDSFYGQVGLIFSSGVPVSSFQILTAWGDIVRPAPGFWGQAECSYVAPSGAIAATVVLLFGIDKLNPVYPATMDWDALQIEDGVRYRRGGTYISGDNFSYQLVTADMPAKGTYSIITRGRDGTSEGPWSEPTVIRYADGPTATIISPTPGQVFTTSTPLFAWTLTAGKQWAYKVEVLDTSGVLVYSSNWIQSTTTRSFQVSSDAGLVDGGSYIGRLWLDDGLMQFLA